MTMLSRFRNSNIPVVPGVAVGWVLIGALVLVFPEEGDAASLFVSVLATTITVLFVHFIAELIFGRHTVGAQKAKFTDLLRLEFISNLWMFVWILPALIPSILYLGDEITFSQTSRSTILIIQGLALVLGFFVAWSRGQAWWKCLLIGCVFSTLITCALMIETITHFLVSILH